MRRHVISAIVRRELAAYFSSPTGYVFITIFVFLSAMAAFWLPAFFDRNLANLDQLNAWYPALLLFLVPAITMSSWAEERKQGTEELLLTLPAHDWQLVLGKYLACLSIYTVALGFSLSNVAVLAYLGSPDPGVMVATYVGQWLAGAALIAVSMAASALTSNLTVAFILGALFCGGVVGLGGLVRLWGGSPLAELAPVLSFSDRLDDFGRGVVTLDNVGYFAVIAGIGVWLNVFLIGRRHWAGSRAAATRSTLALVRGVAFVVAAGAFVVLLGRTPVRADATSERLWSLSGETRTIIHAIPDDTRVLITAYISPEVPAAYAQTRETLVGLLRELDRMDGGGKIAVRIVPTTPLSEEAREADRSYGVKPRTVPPQPGDPEPAAREVFLGVAVTCGPEQTVIPFMHKGLTVEYELVRAIQTVAHAKRKKVGILDTDAKLFGQFDYQTFTPGRDWPIVDELKKQYDVVRVERGKPIPDDLDVLLVAQPSTLTEEQFAPVLAHVSAGKPTLILEDPLPLVNPGIATSEPRGADQNPFQRQQQPQQAPKADLAPLYRLLNVECPDTRVIWDAYNPRPNLTDLPREFVFIGRGSRAAAPFNESDPITSGLQEVVLMAAGEIVPAPQAGASVTVTPLLTTSPVSGFVNYSDELQRTFFGPAGFNPRRRFMQTAGGHVLAAHITGRPAPDAAGEQPKGEGDAAPAAGAKAAAPSINVVLITDLDMMSEVFFNLREEGVENFVFDNVTLVLNAVDTLAGDESLIDLRKRRREHRTLTRLEARRLQQQRDALGAVEQASNRAEGELAKARARMNEKVKEIESRKDLDDTTRQIMIQSVRQTEQRRLDVQSASIEDEKQSAINDASARARHEIQGIQMGIRFAAVAIPPIPAFALGCMVFVRRRAQEREGVARERLKE